MIKKYEFETYETNNASDLDRHLEAAYNDGWFLRDGINMIPTGIRIILSEYEKTLDFIYSVTMFRVVEVNEPEEEVLEVDDPYYAKKDQKGPDSAAEIVNPTTGTEDEYYCVSCGSRNVLSAEIYIHDKHYVERVCGDCHSDAIAIYKKY